MTAGSCRETYIHWLVCKWFRDEIGEWRMFTLQVKVLTYQKYFNTGTAFTFKGNTLCFLFVHILTIALQVVCECLQASSIQTTSLWTISPSDSKQLPATVFRKYRWLLEVTGLSLSLYDLGLRLILFWEADFFHMLMLFFEMYNVRHSLGKLQNCFLIIHVVSFTLLRFPIFHILKLSLCNIH